MSTDSGLKSVARMIKRGRDYGDISYETRDKYKSKAKVALQ